MKNLNPKTIIADSLETAFNLRTYVGRLLREMQKIGNSVEVSFISKLMATVNPNLPFWDKYVLQISDCYSDFLGTEDGEQCIASFDEALPKYKEKTDTCEENRFLAME